MRVLVVDDHPEVLDLVARALTRDAHEVMTATSTEEAEALLEQHPAAVIVLDVALPDGSGVELCRRLRRAGVHTPILLLTAHSAVDRRVDGLNAGADDFLGKPFTVAELRARVRALGRRGAMPGKLHIERGTVTLDLLGRRAMAAGREVPLTAREWSVLELLASRSGRVVARSEILEIVWGKRIAVFEGEVFLGGDRTLSSFEQGCARAGGLRRCAAANGGRVCVVAAPELIAGRVATFGLAALVALVSAFALGALIGRRAARWAVEPISDLADRVSSAESSVPELGPDRGVREVDELRRSLERAWTRLAEALATARRFSADAAHELRTPLSPASSSSSRNARPNTQRSSVARVRRPRDSRS